MKNDICKVEDCLNLVTKKQGSLCEVHRYRWEKFKSFDKPIKKSLPDGIVKICEIHGSLTKDKVHSSFRKGRNFPQLRCYKCYLETQRKSKKKDRIENKKELSIKRKAYYLKTIHKQHANNRKRRFGITQEQYQLMLDKQNNLCAICKLPETVKRKGKIKKLSIDHCHESEKKGIMKIRGLLCLRCNIAFGAFRESIEILQNAIEYASNYLIANNN